MEYHEYEDLPIGCKIYNFEQMKALRMEASKKKIDPMSLTSKYKFTKPANWIITNDQKWLHKFCTIPMKKYFTKDFLLEAKYSA